MKASRWILLFFLLAAGVLLGSLIASACEGVSWLSWLSFSGEFGIGAAAPMVLDLSVIRLTFGLSLSISVAQILTIGAALYAYIRLSKRL